MPYQSIAASLFYPLQFPETYLGPSKAERGGGENIPEREIVTEQNNPEEYEDWDKDAQTTDFVQLPATVQFIRNNPVKTRNNWNRDTWRWPVKVLPEGGNAYESTLSVTSKRLLRALLSIKPLQGKVVRIEKDGDGMNTHYEARAV